MAPTTRASGFVTETVDARRDLSFEETRSTDGEQVAREPVEIIAGLNMSDQLRAMFGTQETVTILPHMYADLRERLDHLTSQITSLTESQTHVIEASREAREAREALVETKSSVQDLREMVEAHTRETDREAAAAESEIRVLRGRIENVADVIPDPKVLEEQVVALTSRIHDTEKDLSRALTEIRDLNQLTSSLSRENTLLRDQVRALRISVSTGTDSRDPLPLYSRQGGTRVDPNKPQSPVVESASQAQPPRQDTYALPAPPRIHEQL